VSEKSSIEWTDTTWNPVTGCTKVSPGCAHCYAETFAERFRGVPGHPFEQGFDLKLWPERLSLPLKWKKPRRVFVNSMSDLFHEDVPFEFIDRVFAVMALTPQHTYQVLTKRPERMREYLSGEVEMRLPVPNSPTLMRPRSQRIWLEAQGVANNNRSKVDFPWSADWAWPLPNCWLGTSVENQHWADVRIPELLATPAAVRFLSCEPLLGPLDLRPWLTRVPTSGDGWRLTGGTALAIADIVLDWVIVGGESGPGARPFDLAWARSLVSQCRAAGVAVFYKQGGKSNRCPHSAKGWVFRVHPRRPSDSGDATVTPTTTPFYASQPCGTCSANVGASGTWINDRQRWCRSCAISLRDLLNATLEGS